MIFFKTLIFVVAIFSCILFEDFIKRSNIYFFYSSYLYVYLPGYLPGCLKVFNGALFFTLVTPTFYVCMYAYVQFINGLYTCLAPSRKGCPNPTENKEYYNLMWWFILKLLGLLTFFSILLVADDKLGDFIIFGINTDLFDLRLGGVGPYSMVIIAMVRVSLTYSNERSYIALKVEQREKNEGETEEEEDQEIEQDLEEKEKKKKKGRKKKKKKEKKKKKKKKKDVAIVLSKLSKNFKNSACIHFYKCLLHIIGSCLLFCI